MIRLTVLTLLVSLAAAYPASPDFCADKSKPSLFSQGCSSNVTICNSMGKQMWLLCPFGLVFDGSNEECVDHRLVEECSSMPPHRANGIHTLAGLPHRFCEKFPDGFHAITACSSSVIQCASGVPSLMECPFGLAYDDLLCGCFSPSHVPSCKPPVVPIPVTEEPKPQLEEPKPEVEQPEPEVEQPEPEVEQPKPEVEQPKPEATDAPTPEPAQEEPVDGCEELADGLFEHEPCSSYFLTCSGGVSRLMMCPANLVFDKRSLICDYPGNVEGCSSPPSEVCPEDGYFSYGNCSDIFYACSNGRKIPMYCPAKLAFDETRQLCDYPLAVPACTEDSSEGLPQFESSGVAPPIVEESWDVDIEVIEPEATTPPPQQMSPFCEEKDDGFYSTGCSSEMIACAGGLGTSMFCPTHFVFDQSKQMCEYAEKMSCPTKIHKDLEKCSTKGAMAHGPCVVTFTNCVEGKAYVLACDEGYIFSAFHGTCMEPPRVPACWKRKPKLQ